MLSTDEDLAQSSECNSGYLGTCRSSRRKRKRDFLEFVETAGKQGCHGHTVLLLSKSKSEGRNRREFPYIFNVSRDPLSIKLDVVFLIQSYHSCVQNHLVATYQSSGTLHFREVFRFRIFGICHGVACSGYRKTVKSWRSLFRPRNPAFSSQFIVSLHILERKFATPSLSHCDSAWFGTQSLSTSSSCRRVSSYF
jgi:hypothetical protein